VFNGVGTLGALICLILLISLVCSTCAGLPLMMLGIVAEVDCVN